MTNAFDDAMGRLFADPNLAQKAIYQKADGASVNIHVIAKRADQILNFGDTRVRTGNSLFDVLAADILDPRPGDTLIVERESYIIQGEPVRDQERLVWTLDVRLA